MIGPSWFFRSLGSPVQAMGVPKQFDPLWQWAGVTTLALWAVYGRHLGPFGFTFPREKAFYKTLAVAVLAPWVYQVLPGLFLVSASGTTPHGFWSTLAGAPTAFLQYLLRMLWFAPWIFMHETVGWRGVMLPALVRTGMPLWFVNFFSGLVWSTWHIMVIINGSYVAGDHNANMLIAAFTVTVTAMGTIVNHLRMDSGSIWPAVLIHAAHDVVEGSFLGAYQADFVAKFPSASVWLVGETGVTMMVLLAAWALYLAQNGSLVNAYNKALLEYEQDDLDEREPLING